MKSISFLGICHLERFVPLLQHQLNKQEIPKGYTLEKIVATHLDKEFFDKDVKILFKEPDEPLGLTRNRLLDSSKGHYKLFFDQDDIYGSFRTKYMIRIFDTMCLDSGIITTAKTLNLNLYDKSIYYSGGGSPSLMCFKNCNDRFDPTMRSNETSSINSIRVDTPIDYGILLNHGYNVTNRLMNTPHKWDSILERFDKFELNFLKKYS